MTALVRLVAVPSTRRARPCQRILQRRQFFWKVLGGSSSVGNQVVEDVLKNHEQNDGSSPSLPKFAKWNAKDFIEAVDQHKIQHDKDMEQWKKNLQEKVGDTKDGSRDDASEQTVTQWEQFNTPIDIFRNTSNLFCILSDPAKQTEWYKARAHVASNFPNPLQQSQQSTLPPNYEEILGMVQSKLQKGLQDIDTTDNQPTTMGDDEQQQPILFASQYLERTIRQTTGLGLAEEDRQKFQQVLLQLQEVNDRMLQRSEVTKEDAPKFLSDVYTTIDLKHQHAKLLGHSTFADQILDQRMATVEDLQELHSSVSESLLPKVKAINYDPFDDRKFYKANNIPVPTLDGCLNVLGKLLFEVFRVDMREMKDTTTDIAWHRDARVFQLYNRDENSKEEEGLLGTIILDPFQRPGKLKRSFLIPIIHRQQCTPPVVGIALELVAPVWADDAVQVTWQDAESLFHEMAHALQIILAKPGGGLLGAHNLPLDVQEILSKFMESCLFEESCLDAIMESSSRNASSLTPEWKKALWDWRNDKKALQLMQTIFFGALELELFSTFDPHGEESLVGLQRRLAAQFVPHDLPAKNDLSPLLRVMQQNAAGTHLGLYRYLWGEVYAAGLFHCFVEEDGGTLLDGGSTERQRQQLRREFLYLGAVFDVGTSLREFACKELGSPAPLIESITSR